VARRARLPAQRHYGRCLRAGRRRRHAELIASYLSAWEPYTFTDLDVPELLRHSRGRGIKVGVLSNTMWPREWHENVFRRDGVLDLIDGAVYSSEIDEPHRARPERRAIGRAPEVHWGS
jgi:FMN phosphatase YigB (HAD superfamily)